MKTEISWISNYKLVYLIIKSNRREVFVTSGIISFLFASLLLLYLCITFFKLGVFFHMSLNYERG